ncbi:MCE family protein [Actinomadura madurae]|uniref:MCE family protein n=1 Tax=Actinomadura madurae TaxID=1993 RepID=UPI002027614E|nr:MCE family protein [Actinomadura madurae]MCP9952977.1 MCE family protein [Actinomadura madurae]MCP9982194.1 MCE family protein [Actinomadura madurae]MCQ0006277.1 MCE family protein [Actinomadura madurae]MCQ0018444.1 MCE family protein [Actinomadura madurae]URM98458.1 MCE family protein [Actinomadura madurae]
MRTTSAAIKLAIFVVITSVATGTLAMTISNMRFRETATYKAVFTDVTGLLDNDDVRVAGVRVGQIEHIELYKGTQARVTFSLEKDGVFQAGLPSSTQAQIRYRNLMGQRYLALTDGAGQANDYLKPGGTIPASQTKPALDLTTLFNGFRPLFTALEPKDVNTLAMQIIQVLQGEGGTINSLLAHVASLTNTLADRDKVIGRVIDNLNTVLGTIDERHAEVNRLITDLRGFVSGVSGDRQAIFDSVSAINDLTGTTQDLLADARPDIRDDIAGLRKLTGTFAANGKDIDAGLRRSPKQLEGLVNISSYGSWFNMYICGLDARVRLPGGPVYQTPAIVNENARCK